MTSVTAFVEGWDFVQTLGEGAYGEWVHNNNGWNSFNVYLPIPYHKIPKAWPWIIVGNMFRECHTSCTLKTMFMARCTRHNNMW